MTNFKKQAFSVLAAGSLLVSLATPAFASTTIQISGNGAGANNAAVVSQSNTTTVTQNNNANVSNNVTSNADTGNNDAKYNTGGGGVTVKTGAASTTTNVTNNLNSNTADDNGCNCGTNTDALISGNGAFSTNQVTLGNTNANSVTQKNNAKVDNDVQSNANTGGNDANLNTGGDTVVWTGGASSTTNVTTAANANVANIGGGAGVGAVAPTASFKIVGNGAGSNNWIGATLANSNSATQSNSAYIDNDVNSNAKTGDNDAKYNTGGNILVKTGMADAGATVDNMVNFNSANLDCGCVTDVLAKIDGNGATPEGWNWDNSTDPNSIVLALSNANAVGQGNSSSLDNDVNSNAKTGYNDAELNTGDVLLGNDPAIVTGDSLNTTGVNNSGNVNVVGSTPVVMPLPGGNSVGLSFNVQALLAFFGLSM